MTIGVSFKMYQLLNHTHPKLKTILLKLLILMVLTSIPEAISQDSSWQSYVSPGLQIGYGFGEGMYIGGQITIGMIHSNINNGGNRQYSYPFPGATVGARKLFDSNGQLMGYWDFQVSALFLGAGIGKTAIKIKSNDSWVFGNRAKLWAGSIGLLTYDYSKVKDKKSIHSLGLAGVLPFTEAQFID